VVEWLRRVTAWIEFTLGISEDVQLRILATLGVFFAYAIALRVLRRIVARTVTDATNRYQVVKAITYFFGFLAVAVVAKVWLQGVTGLATYLGLLSAGVAVSLQDPIINLAGWLFIVSRRPFEVGDRIQIGPHTGDVVDIQIFQFTLLEVGNWVHADQSTGRVIQVPNGWVFKNPVANYDKGFRYIWHEIEVVLTFESNWRRAKEVLLKTVTDHAEHLTADATRQIQEAADRYHIKFTKLTPVVWTSVVDHGIRLTMRYLCKPRERRKSANEMWESILEALEKLPDVDMAYTTVRYFDHRFEGKPNAKPSAEDEKARLSTLPEGDADAHVEKA
jgi:small-conductance mechanosensitive channel